METNSSVQYPTERASKKVFLFHRGPGSARFLWESVARHLGEGKLVSLIHNTSYTDKVELSAHEALLTQTFSLGAPFTASNKALIFGQYDFSGVVGLWLQAGRSEASYFLSPFISVDSFEFTPAEFLDLRERIEQTIRRQERLPRVSSALEDLNTGFFRHQTLAESEAFIKAHLETYLAKAKSLKAAYLAAINSYARNSIFQRRREIIARELELEQLEVAARAVTELKGRKARKAQQALSQQQVGFIEKWHGVGDDYLEIPFATFAERERSQLQADKAGVLREFASANLSLSEVTVDADLGEEAVLASLAKDLEQLIVEIDESGLFQLPIGGAVAATASRQLQRLEGVLQRLNNSYCHLAELPDFYAHRHFWYAQPSRLRRLLAPLQELPTEDWVPAFTSWYFERCLEQFAYAQGGTSEAVSAVREPVASSGAVAEKPDLSKLHILQVDEAVPEATEVLVDFFGLGPPEGFKGIYYGKRPLTDTTALHHNVAGVVDPRLVLLQTFVPLSPPSWKAVAAEQAPPGTGSAIALQVREDAPWMPLSTWKPTPTEHLRLYLPETFADECGTAFLRRFEDIVEQSTKLTLFHAWSPGTITQALLSDGLNPAFLMAALLRAAEASSETPYDREALMAVGQEIRGRCGITEPTRHPLAERLQEQLQQALPGHFFTLHQAWRDTFLPLVVLSPAGKKTVLLPGGRLPGYADEHNEALRQRELNMAGMTCYSVDAYACWEDFSSVLATLVDYLTGD